MTDDTDLREKLKAETDTLPWSELVRHFAFGRLYVVRNPWELVDAAVVLKSDDAARLQTAMNDSHFGAPTADEVALWHETKMEFEVLVMSPFVLVKPLSSPVTIQ